MVYGDASFVERLAGELRGVAPGRAGHAARNVDGRHVVAEPGQKHREESRAAPEVQHAGGGVEAALKERRPSRSAKAFQLRAHDAVIVVGILAPIAAHGRAVVAVVHGGLSKRGVKSGRTSYDF